MQNRLRVGTLRRLGPVALAMLISGLAGMIFPFLQGVFSLKLVLGGAALGCVITLLLVAFETLIYARRLRQMDLKKAIALKALVYAGLITACYVILSLMVKQETSAAKVLTFQSVFTFSLVASLIISSFVSISRILGQNELILLVLGRYHKPREEERIVMFLDLAGSTTIAEKIGSVPYLKLLNDFFYDLTGPILDTHGEIYKYVGDEVIVTWKLKPGVSRGNCLECYFKIREAIDRNAAAYQEKYGLVPDFRAGLHAGTVVIGEMGDFKKEIAILGDTINTASRVISETRSRDVKFLVSHAVRDLIVMQPKHHFGFHSLASIQLRGRQAETTLYAVERLAHNVVLPGAEWWHPRNWLRKREKKAA
jgi:class 3 adenylate cyclase